MADAPEPVLVYDRVAANRRATRRLLALFTLLILPFAAGLVPLVAPAIYFGVLVPALGRVAVARLYVGAEGTVLMLAATAALTLLAVLVVGIGVAAVELRHSTRLVLRLTRARLVGTADEPALVRTVENLSLAAGLPTPKTYVVESPTVNAFAVGLDPRHAAVVVTRGLLELLDRRGLHGVVAHELSHIGNQDTRLNTLLAAVLAVFRLPATLLRAWSPRVSAGCLILSGLMFVLATLSIVAILAQLGVAAWYFSDELRTLWTSAGRTDVLVAGTALLYGPLAMGSPFYVLAGAQICARGLGGAVSREREFLADADAVLLTRDPEGLALALVMTAANRSAESLPRAAAHLFLVEPVLPPTSWWDRAIASHPSIEERVAVLARMGSGIPAETLSAARDAGERFRRRPAPVRSGAAVPGHSTSGPHPHAGPAAENRDVGTSDPTRVVSYVRVKDRSVALLATPDATGPVHDHVGRETVLILLGVETGFLRVQTNEGTIGYIPESTPLVWDD